MSKESIFENTLNLIEKHKKMKKNYIVKLYELSFDIIDRTVRNVKVNLVVWHVVFIVILDSRLLIIVILEF